MAKHGRTPLPHPSTAVQNLVVIGASAGGVTAVGRVLAGLPGDLPAAVVVVQHLAPTFKSKLVEILRSRTALQVEQAGTRKHMRLGHVYVAPPDYHVKVDTKGRLHLDASAHVNFARPAIDPLFTSAANAFGDRVLAVVLSGYGRDGSEGVRAVRAHGGHVIAEDESTAAQFAMPNNAIGTGSVEYVLPLDAIPERIIQLLTAQ